MRKFAALTLIIVVTIGAVLFIVKGSWACDDAGQAVEIVVEQGDTLWRVAVRAVPDTDPRRTVDEIMELNGLESSLITPGQSLLVPVSG